MRLHMRTAAVLFAVGMSPAAASVQVLDFRPIADTVIYYDGPDGSATTSASNGLGENLSVGQDAGGVVRRSLIRFDLSSIVPGSVIEAVELQLFETPSPANYDISIHRLTQTWGEGTSNGGSAGAMGLATAGDATWNSAVLPDATWQTPGGDFVAPASATTLVGFAGAFYTWSSAQMLSDVQTWVDAPAGNHGWILIGVENDNQNPKLFNSAQSPVPPVLTVYVTPVPEPEALAMFTLGVGVIAWRLQRRNRRR